MKDIKVLWRSVSHRNISDSGLTHGASPMHQHASLPTSAEPHTQPTNLKFPLPHSPLPFLPTSSTSSPSSIFFIDYRCIIFIVVVHRHCFEVICTHSPSIVSLRSIHSLSVFATPSLYPQRAITGRLQQPGCIFLSKGIPCFFAFQDSAAIFCTAYCYKSVFSCTTSSPPSPLVLHFT